ncbi:MAG: aminotransferase class III-fold pyridoxal phosphate-dependent enzyme [Polyangiaceae bacterium]
MSEVVLPSSGDELPVMRHCPPGPLSRAWTLRAEAVESPAFRARRDAREASSGESMGPIVYASARGSNVVDVDGNLYVDLTAGFGAELLGHHHPRVVAALEAQAARLWHALGDVFTADSRIALMESLAAIFPESGARVILGQAGADAVTAALKTALLATSKPGVLAFEGSYHGMSYAPLAASGLRASYRDPFAAQLSPHVRFAPYPISSNDADAVLSRCREVLSKGDIGAVLIEPVLGRGGCFPAPGGFLGELASLAARSGALPDR